MRHPSSSPPLIGQPASATNNDQLLRLSSDPEDLSIHSNSSCSFTSTAPKTEVSLKDKPIDVTKAETNCHTSSQPGGKVQESGGPVLTGSKVPTWTQTQLQEAIEAVITQRMRFTQVNLSHKYIFKVKMLPTTLSQTSSMYGGGGQNIQGHRK